MTQTRASLGGRLPRPEPWQRNAALGIVGTTIVAGWIGTALFATLVDRHPLLLITLNATPKYLVLTVNELDGWAYYLVATTRLMITKPLMWLIGGWYGNRAVAWAARRSERTADLIRWVEAQFSRLGWFIIPITSNNPVCLLAGSTGFPLLPFLALALAGTLTRLVIYDAFGERFQDPIDRIVQLVTDYRIPVVIVCTVGVVGGILIQRRRGTSPLGILAELDDADRQADAEDDGDHAGRPDHEPPPA